MDTFLNVLPPELRHTPALAAGFMALLGLILLTTGIKVARPLSAALVGAMLAATSACLLPAFMAIDSLTSGVIGLALGLLIGGLAFRAVQGAALALVLAIISANAFYQFQAANHPWSAPRGGVATLNAASTAGRIVAALPASAQTTVNTMVARWGTVPQSLRQSMLVIGAGVAVLAIFVSFVLPRGTTWVMSAVGGVTLFVYGGFVLLSAYRPGMLHYIPSDTPTRLILVAALAAIGMVVQWLYFWPGKRQKEERAKDREGELVPA